MKKRLFNDWWKYLGLGILLYVFAGGFLVPLRPGVMHVVPDRIQTGQEVSIHVDLYNTKYDESTDLHVFLRLDSVHTLESTKNTLTSRNNLDVVFELPATLPNQAKFTSASLILHDPESGFIVAPAALTLLQDSVASQSSETDWNAAIHLKEGPWKLQFPFVGILYETIRNTFFHVAIWFAMFFLMTVSLINCVRYLQTADLHKDVVASSFAYVAILFGMMGMITGSIWAKHTWGVYWTSDPKLNLSAVALIIYLAYAILRSAINDTDQKARVSAAYNIFAFVAMIPLVFVIPRLTSSLHPGNGGNPALGGEDLDNTLRLFFYPAIIGLILIGTWMAQLLVRINSLKIKLIERELS